MLIQNRKGILYFNWNRLSLGGNDLCHHRVWVSNFTSNNLVITIMANKSSVVNTVTVETLSSNEVISCLYSKSSAEKCRIGLTDVVVYEYGIPARWYVTSKTGDVVRKKEIDKSLLSHRWVRMNSQSNKSPFVAIIRQEGGLYKFLNENNWSEFISTEQMPDNSIISLHCYVKGDSNLVYRNKFELRDRLGRFVTSTYSYSFFDSNLATDSIVMARESKLEFTETRAPALKNIMDLATNTVVRYLEMMLGIRVLSISVDYVIDPKSQLWMMWPSVAKVVRDIKLWEHHIPGLDNSNFSDRMGWANLPMELSPIQLRNLHTSKGVGYEKPLTPPSAKPSKTRDTIAVGETVLDERHTTSSKVKSVTTGYDFIIDSSSKKSGSAGRGGEINLQRIVKLNPIEASAQFSAASTTIDESIAKHSSKGRRTQQNRLLQSGAPFVVYDGLSKQKGEIEESSHPGFSANPFSCKGDYCKIVLQTTLSLHTDPSLKVHTVESFFSGDELSLLKKKNSSTSMLDPTGGPAGSSTDLVSMSSIRLARAEMRGLTSLETKSQPWDKYPTGNVNVVVLRSASYDSAAAINHDLLPSQPKVLKLIFLTY